MKRKFTALSPLLLSLCLGILSSASLQAQTRTYLIYGKIINSSGTPLAAASIMAEGTSSAVISGNDGSFKLKVLAHTDSAILKISNIGYRTEIIHLAFPVRDSVKITLKAYDQILAPVEVFGTPRTQPDKLDALTGLPLPANQQIQSISIISNRLITEQDVQNLSDATRNVVGVTLFSSFGEVSNSFTIRGMRGAPTLKNGVRINNDSRGHGEMPDMEGVDNIQVLKGSSAISQGLSNTVGSAGGVINVVTKTPHFIDAGNVGLRYGSWDNVRGTYDVEHVVSDNVAFRIDGAIQKGDGYRATTKNDRFYINPSLAWKPDEKTKITFELDYLHDNRTPDRGTVNLGADSVNGLWKIPNNKFLGFSTDHSITDSKSWGVRVERNLNQNFDFKINYYGSTFRQDFTSAVTSALNNNDRSVRYRYINRITEDDKSSVLNLSLVGHDLYTGPIKHTVQVGLDYRSRTWYSQTFNSNNVDTINIYANFTNTLLNQNLTYTENKGRYYNINYNDYGLFGQDMITFNKYVRGIVGARYSFGNSLDNKISTYASGNGVDPIVGLFISPVQQLNFFGSYTTVTDISTADYVDANGKRLGNGVTHQFEAGLKSSYFHDRLRFNLTYFNMNNSNYSYQVTNTTTHAVYYNQSGSLKRTGIETEVTGHILPSVEVIMGYTHLNAKYEGVKSFVDGSTPMGAPKDIANSWINYLVSTGVLKGLSVGAGVYYVGARPIDDYTKATTASIVTGGSEIQKIAPGVRPFNLDAYTTINGQVSYMYRQVTFRVVVDNIGNSTGYVSYYPQGFINPTTPRNLSLSMNYSF
ncbi:MAG: hypothetical protein JWR38_4437 [Mucilaginibacter sp.]|nr:hypothetical protein [Mucilaginibacter sp.]